MRLRNVVLLTVLVLAAVVIAGCTPGVEGETPAAGATSTAAPPTETADTPVPPSATPEPAGATPSPTAPAEEPDALAGSEWLLVSFGPVGAEEPVVAGSEITLSFVTGGQAGGSGGCNSYGGSYQVDGSKVTFGEIVSTLMACADEAVNEQEGRYLAALGAATSFEMRGDSLTIHYDEGQGALNFIRQGAATPTPAGEMGSAVQLRELFMVAASSGWALGQVEGDPAEQVLFTADGGASWEVRTPPETPPSGESLEQTIPAAATFTSAERGWISYLLPAPIPAGATPVVWRTEDGGESWEASAPLDLGGMPYEHFVPSGLGFLDDGFGWLLAHLGAGMSHDYIAVYTTADGGGTWQRVTDPESSPDIQACNKSGLLFTSSSDGWLSGDCPGLMPQLFLYRTADGGATWSPVLLPLAEGQTASGPEQLGDSCGVRQMVQVEGTLLLALHCFDFEANTGQPYLYRSEDGDSWTAAALPAANGLFDFTSPLEGWYLGEGEESGAALFYTDDGGQTWAQQPAPDRPGQIAFVDAQHGWVLSGVGVGDAAGLWRLSEDGAGWQQLHPAVTP